MSEERGMRRRDGPDSCFFARRQVRRLTSAGDSGQRRMTRGMHGCQFHGLEESVIGALDRLLDAAEYVVRGSEDVTRLHAYRVVLEGGRVLVWNLAEFVAVLGKAIGGGGRLG